MRRPKKTSLASNKLALAIGSVAVGSLFGYLSAHSAMVFMREPSSERGGAEIAASALAHSRNDYSTLPCADEVSMKRYMTRLKVNLAPTGKICGDASNYEKLGKLLRFMEESRFLEDAMPEYGGFRAARAPLDFVGGLVDSVNFAGFDASSKSDTVAAYNSDGDVYVGPRVLDSSPITGAMVLLHEAHHSEATDARHVTCVAGDIAGQKGGCDASYSSRTGMGAYSVSVQFYLAVSKFGLNFSEVDREYARAQAMALLDSRFNSLPAEQASLETMMLLDNTGALRLLHPIARTLMGPLGVTPALDVSDRLDQILEATQGKLCARSISGALRCGKRLGAWRDPLEGVRGAQTGSVRDFRMLLADHVLPYVLAADNTVSTLRVDPENGKYFLKASSYKPRVQLQRLLSVLGFQRMVLSSEGELFPFTPDPADFTSKSFARDESGLGYSDAGGGFLGSDLWMIQNSTGRLLYWNKAKAQIEASLLQCPGGALQYAEGATMRVLLCKDGSLVLKSYAQAKLFTYTVESRPAARLVSVGVLPRFLLGKDFLPKLNTQAVQNFQLKCGVRAPFFDVWTDGLMGLDLSGRLVVTGPSETTCRVSQHPAMSEAIEAIGFSSAELENTDRSYAPSRAMLRFKDGRRMSIESNF